MAPVPEDVCHDGRTQISVIYINAVETVCTMKPGIKVRGGGCRTCAPGWEGHLCNKSKVL